MEKRGEEEGKDGRRQRGEKTGQRIQLRSETTDSSLTNNQ